MTCSKPPFIVYRFLSSNVLFVTILIFFFQNNKIGFSPSSRPCLVFVLLRDALLAYMSSNNSKNFSNRKEYTFVDLITEYGPITRNFPFSSTRNHQSIECIDLIEEPYQSKISYMSDDDPNTFQTSSGI